MKRRFTAFLMVCSVFFLQTRCSDDEASAPPRSSFTMTTPSPSRANDTEFTFVVDQVDAQDISLLPYGAERPNLGGIRIPNSSFKDGKATVKFTYAEVGTFSPVVATNNHTADGESVKTVYSEAKSVTITSDRNTLSEFSFEKSTASSVVQATKKVTVTVPYGTDVKTLKAKFVVSPFTTVSVNGAAQKSDETVNDFTNPVTYVVKANEGNEALYEVTVIVTPIEKLVTLKSFTGKIASKSDKDKVLGSDVNNAAHDIVLYGPAGIPADRYDSVRVKWETDGKFAYTKFGAAKLKQDSLLNLSSSKSVTVFSQDSLSAGGTQAYSVYATTAPSYNLQFAGLIPQVTGTVDGFTITLKVLKATNLTNLIATEVDKGANIVAVKANGAPFVSGVTPLDYRSNVKFELTVTDPGIGKTYTVVYTVTVFQLN